MNKNIQRILLAASAAFGLTACPSDPAPTDGGGGTDTGSMEDTGGGGGEDAPVAANDCATYCAAVTANCTGDDAQYLDSAQCLAYCAGAGWVDGTPGMASGNSVACRIYHAGAAADDPATHCIHAGPTGGSVCGAAIDFRTDAPTAYTRVDRMGEPAVSTALIPSARKNGYNDNSPADDVDPVMGDAGTMITSLTALHTALDADLTALGMTPCSMTTLVDTGTAFGMLPECLGQPIAGPGTPPVAALVLPDTINIDPDNDPAFPNGRRLEDAVIDPILAAILLDINGGTCGTSACSAATFATIPLNPAGNDVANTVTGFPYLEAAHPAP